MTWAAQGVANHLTEAAWQDQVIELGAFYGWRHWHDNDSRRNVAGWPDLVLIRPPEFIIVELKTDTGRVRKEQQVWLDDLTACGIETHVWRPRDFDAVHDRLRRKAVNR